MQSTLRPPREHVGSQFIGWARLLRNEVLANDEAYCLAVQKITAPLLARRRRYPDRSQRPDALSGVVAAFRQLDKFRLRLDVDRSRKHRLVIDDYHIGASDWRDPRWEGDVTWQGGIAILILTLTVDLHGVDISGKVVANLALHAVGRYFSRTGKRDTALLLEDLRPLIDCTDPGRVACPRGWWRGDIVMTRDMLGRTGPSRGVRTFVSSDMIEDMPAAAMA